MARLCDPALGDRRPLEEGPKSPWGERPKRELTAEEAAAWTTPDIKGLEGWGDIESASLYDALAYDIIKGRDGNVVRVFPGRPPHEVDELELWQIAHLIGTEDRERPEPPTPPPDWDQRVARYSAVMEKRRKAEKAKGR